MQRRQCLTLLAGLAVTGGTQFAQAEEEIFSEFSEERFEQALTSGEPFMVGFLSSW